MPSDFSFDLKALRARDEINDALGIPQNQRMPNLGPVPNQQPMQIPGNPQLTRQGLAVSGQQQLGPGVLSGNATLGLNGFRGTSANYGAPVAGGQLNLGANVGPQGFGGASVNYGRPVAGGQLNLGASMDPRMRLAQLNAQYQRGPVSAGVNYQPNGAISGGLSYRQPFQEGGLATSIRNDPVYHDRDVEFLNTRNQRMREVAGLQAYAKGGGAWTRKEGQNPEGGLNAVGRASLKAQGHDIKPPVSAKQAKKSPKAAARRKSFCARMSGMPGPMKDEKGRPTRKALSLRKWDC
jgi:hypothetical protein